MYEVQRCGTGTRVISSEAGPPSGGAEDRRRGQALHAKEAGAKILEEPKDQFYGDRCYGAEDSEGHHWFFAQHVRDVAAEDMKPPA